MRIKRSIVHLCLAMLFIAILPVLNGCARFRKESAMVSSIGENSQQTRVLIKSACLRIETRDVSEAADKASAIATKTGGYIEKSNIEKDSAFLRMHIPAKHLESTLDNLAALGVVKEREISIQDVTESLIDMESMLKNKIALRDRLRNLLEKAKDVKDVLSIEEQLTRLQTEIDAMEGKLRALKGQVELSPVNLTIERKKILGPLGYLFKGTAWVVEKMFVID